MPQIRQKTVRLLAMRPDKIRGNTGCPARRHGTIAPDRKHGEQSQSACEESQRRRFQAGAMVTRQVEQGDKITLHQAVA